MNLTKINIMLMGALGLGFSFLPQQALAQTTTDSAFMISDAGSLGEHFSAGCIRFQMTTSQALDTPEKHIFHNSVVSTDNSEVTFDDTRVQRPNGQQYQISVQQTGTTWSPLTTGPHSIPQSGLVIYYQNYPLASAAAVFVQSNPSEQRGTVTIPIQENTFEAHLAMNQSIQPDVAYETQLSWQIEDTPT
ncbi:hypothetical protein H9L19_03275 [Weissella diestrammenae]|uniref:WxL domain-containing protein n=1 Tax=Weissella diestrammenae TaxID=1162633 RepID=A0A7G9T719_9LACO|nr:hypothetical protein [Weissella diestrammenae]MCM0582509.1 hypothetical protein [Weissella diestrammenae]QNN75894.1 hypothetical protein H9L19_03275 [Weissella diestrammenae]